MISSDDRSSALDDRMRRLYLETDQMVEALANGLIDMEYPRLSDARRAGLLPMYRSSAARYLVPRIREADHAARVVLIGGFIDEPLTGRELDVLSRLSTLATNEEIAADLFISVNTVKVHIRTLYRKLGVQTRRDAVRRARELELETSRQTGPPGE